MKKLLSLFLSMLKIGAFTFGGGYAMIAILEHEFVDRRGYMTKDEFYDLLAIAESTPGPIAINSSTYIGYKTAGVLGSIFATLGMVLPSFVIIFAISLFFDAFLSLAYVGYAFAGIKVGVCYLILNAGIRMIRDLKKNAVNITLLLLTLASLVTLTLLSVKFSSIFYILIAAAVGVGAWALGKIKEGKRK